MNTIEEQLTRDFEVVTGQMVVTDSELTQARTAIGERLQVSREGARRRRLALGVVAAVVLPVCTVAVVRAVGEMKSAAAPVSRPTDPTAEDLFLAGGPPTTEALSGVWRVDNGTMLVWFSGTDEVALDNRGRLFADPLMKGTYAIEGDEVTVSVVSGSADCIGKRFAIRVALPDDETARVVPARAPAGDCSSPMGMRESMERLLPTSEGLQGIVAGKKHWEPVPAADDLHAVWMAQGGGYLLELDPEGTYYVADATGRFDRGEWSVRGSRLTLASSAESTACSSGDELVWGDLQWRFRDMTTIRATARTNTCAAPWAAVEAWIEVPQQD